MIRHALRGFGGDRRGMLAMEMGFLALPMALLLFGAFELGSTLKTRAALQYGAELAARCAVVAPATCGTSTQVQAYVAPRLSGVALPANTFSLATASCGKQVSASMAYNGPAKHVLRREVTLTARSCYPV